MSDVLAQAIAAHKHSKTTEAEQGYQTWLKQHPHDGSTWHLLGILYGQLESYEAAISAFEKALPHHAEPALIHQAMSQAYLHLGQTQPALSHIQSALRLKPNQATFMNQHGNIYLRLGHHAIALNHYHQAHTCDPTYLEAKINIGMTQLKLKQVEAAQKTFQAIIEQDPKHPIAQQQLGQIHHQAHAFDQALLHYKAALDSSPRNALLHHQIACIYCQKEDPTQAIESFKTALKYDPHHFESHHNLGALYTQIHQPADALPHWLKALRSPEDTEGLYNIGTTYLALNRTEEAKAYLLDALQHGATDASLHIALGAVYLKTDEPQQALIHYQTALKEDPSREDIRYVLDAIQNQPTRYSRSPATYVKNLFDQYAERFDQHLTQTLNYKTPEILAAQLIDLTPKHGFNIALDLGCGTGLAAQACHHLTQRLIGVDLSEGMLKKADQTGLYEALHCQDIIDYLSKTIDFKPDLILAADVLPYFGELIPLMQAIVQNMSHQGVFAFTYEHLENTSSETLNPSFKLQTCARYAHDCQYIQQCLNAVGLMCHDTQSVTLREQHQVAVQGHYVIAVKPK